MPRERNTLRPPAQGDDPWDFGEDLGYDFEMDDLDEDDDEEDDDEGEDDPYFRSRKKVYGRAVKQPKPVGRAFAWERAYPMGGEE